MARRREGGGGEGLSELGIVGEIRPTSAGAEGAPRGLSSPCRHMVCRQSHCMIISLVSKMCNSLIKTCQFAHGAIVRTRSVTATNNCSKTYMFHRIYACSYDTSRTPVFRKDQDTDTRKRDNRTHLCEALALAAEGPVSASTSFVVHGPRVGRLLGERRETVSMVPSCVLHVSQLGLSNYIASATTSRQWLVRPCCTRSVLTCTVLFSGTVHNGRSRGNLM